VILGFDNPSYLDVGQSYTQTVDVPLSIDAQGIWYVYVVPDGTGSHHAFKMQELSRNDKLAMSAGFNVALSPWPVLDVSSVQAPAQVFSGQSMKLKWTVINNGAGTTAASSWIDSVYMSTQPTLDSSAIYLDAFLAQRSLDAGKQLQQRPDRHPAVASVDLSTSWWRRMRPARCSRTGRRPTMWALRSRPRP